MYGTKKHCTFVVHYRSESEDRGQGELKQIQFPSSLLFFPLHLSPCPPYPPTVCSVFSRPSQRIVLNTFRNEEWTKSLVPCDLCSAHLWNETLILLSLLLVSWKTLPKLKSVLNTPHICRSCIVTLHYCLSFWCFMRFDSLRIIWYRKEKTNPTWRSGACICICIGTRRGRVDMAEPQKVLLQLWLLLSTVPSQVKQFFSPWWRQTWMPHISNKENWW